MYNYNYLKKAKTKTMFNLQKKKSYNNKRINKF